MTAQTLPDNPNYCFVPAYDVEDARRQPSRLRSSPNTRPPRMLS